jgi:hypothetical protein
MTVFFNAALCSLVEIDRCFRAIALNMKGVITSETPVDFYETTRRDISEDSHLQEKLDSNSRACVGR